MDQLLFRPPAPLPRKAPLNLLALLTVLTKNPLDVWTEAHFEQPLVRGGLPFMPAVVVSDPRAIRHLLLDNVANYRKDDLLKRILAPGLAGGLLTAEDDQWRRQRHAVAPMFARRTIHGFAPAMRAAIDALLARWRELPDQSVVDVAEELASFTLDVLERTIFSGGLEQGTQAFRDAMRTYFDSIGRIDPCDALGLPGFVPRLTRRNEAAALRFFGEAIDAIVAERRREMDSGKDVPRDLLTLLLEAGEPDSRHRLTEAEVRANILTFIAAGHETTANALTWSLYLLSQSHGWAAAVRAEAEEAASDGDGDPCAGLTSTRAVLEEALRLYPPIAAISRVAIGPDEVAGESIAPGTMVIVAPYVVHRHRLLWDRPDIFDPTRFLGSARESIDRFAYLPFGAGSRICIGSAFALQEATLALAAIMRSVDLQPAPGFAVEPLLRITLRPRQGLPMILRHRTH